MESLIFIPVTLLFCSAISSVQSTCYFSQEFQGEYVMQSSLRPNNGVQYSALNVTENSIPIWGNCHRRIGNNFIFVDNVSETSCIRCLHLKLRSDSILQVFANSQDSLSKCFTNENSALDDCPGEDQIMRRETIEILLFKTRWGRTQTFKQFCPIDGKYLVNYEKSRLPIKNECKGFNSSLDSCPSGSTLNFRLRGCTFDSYDLKFDCLGFWPGPKDETFLVFVDHRYKDGQKPKFRCALYQQDLDTGLVYMSLSKDSTCLTALNSSRIGYESFVLQPTKEEKWPAEASDMCSFPKWMHGHWEHVRVKGDMMVYKDQNSFKTYTIKCVGVQEEENRYLIYTRSQCNEETFNCMRIANRSVNILEFQIGTNSSSNYKDVFTLCSDDNFETDSWITQGRVNDIQPQSAPGMCPILGEYTGQLPDNNMLCGKMWSDCRAPELMYYQVFNCETREIYEDREYRCLGHWKENNVLYTYTQRKDVAADTYECFVGSIIMDTEIHIKEAGEHCQRNIDPYRYGMKLVKAETYSCQTRETTRRPSTNGTVTIPTKEPKTTKKIVHHTDFDNSIPKTDNENASRGISIHQSSMLYIVLYILYKYL